MPNPNAIVDLIQRLDPPAGPGLRAAKVPFVNVHLQGGSASLLDLSKPNAPLLVDVLDGLRQTNQPVYLDVDPKTRVIRQVLLPRVVTVTEVAKAPKGDRQDVALEISHARYFLRLSNPDYKKLLADLQSAQQQRKPVLVTDTPEEHEIIDVRSPVGSAPPGGVTRPPKGGVTVPRGATAPSAVTPSQANQAFQLVNAQSCDPTSPSSTCIPFMYPDDGCWGRAHEMCRLMIAAGYEPRKVWIYGNLRVDTRNHPQCEVFWGWHVTPTLPVDTGASSDLCVIDPSIFTQPQPLPTWVSVQHDPAAVTADTDADVFYRDSAGNVQYDPAYTQTQQVLATYRSRLALRSATVGPPPYANCP
jgi:hypothetical protein